MVLVALRAGQFVNAVQTAIPGADSLNRDAVKREFDGICRVGQAERRPTIRSHTVRLDRFANWRRRTSVASKLVRLAAVSIFKQEFLFKCDPVTNEEVSVFVFKRDLVVMLFLVVDVSLYIGHI